jgi:hypothetical protein
MEGEEDPLNDTPDRKDEESFLGRFTGFLRRPGPEGGGDREPAVVFKEPVAELPRGAPPPAGPGMIIPLRREKGCAGVPPAPPQQKEEKDPPA